MDEKEDHKSGKSSHDSKNEAGKDSRHEGAPQLQGIPSQEPVDASAPKAREEGEEDLKGSRASQSQAGGGAGADVEDPRSGFHHANEEIEEEQDEASSRLHEYRDLSDQEYQQYFESQEKQEAQRYSEYLVKQSQISQNSLQQGQESRNDEVSKEVDALDLHKKDSKKRRFELDSTNDPETGPKLKGKSQTAADSIKPKGLGVVFIPAGTFQQNQVLQPVIPKLAPLSVNGYSELGSKSYAFADKTMLIKELMTNGKNAEIILRPRRFGKSLNLSMVKCYLSNLEAENYQQNFQRTEIFEDSDFYNQYGNKYPLIYLNFSKLNLESMNKNWPEDAFHEIIFEALKPYYTVLESSPLLSELNKRELQAILNFMNPYYKGILTLADLLKQHYKKNCIVLIDEYDAPINSLLREKEKLERFKRCFKMFIQTGLKDNTAIEKSILTGIARVAQSSIYSGFNNAIVNTLLSPDYHQYYGFNEKEVVDILTQVRAREPDTDELRSVKAYYNGYKTPSLEEFYNPFSIVNYAKSKQLNSYWDYTAEDTMLLLPYQNLTETDLLELRSLLEGSCVRKVIFANTSTDEISGPDQFWSLLFYHGYLTFSPQNQGEIKYDVEILLQLANKESKTCLERIESSFNQMVFDAPGQIRDAFSLNKLTQFTNAFNSNLTQDKNKKLINGRTLSGELGYHNLIYWNLREQMKIGWTIMSEGYIEEGKGYFDILVISNNRNIVYILEIKFLPKEERENIERTLQEALQQIEKRKYTQYFMNKEYYHIKQVQWVAVVGCDLQLFQKSGNLVFINGGPNLNQKPLSDKGRDVLESH